MQGYHSDFPRVYHSDLSSPDIQEILAECGLVQDRVELLGDSIHNINRFSTAWDCKLKANGCSPGVIRRVHKLSTESSGGIHLISWVFAAAADVVKDF